MDMKRLLIAVMIMIVGVMPCWAFKKAENPHHAFFEFDFQPDTYTLGVGYHYMLTDFFGVGASLGFMGDSEQSNGVIGSIDDLINGDFYPYYDSDAFTNSAFYFQPSLYFRTPRWKLSSIVGLGASLEPWIRLTTNHYASDYLYHNGRDLEITYRCKTFSAGMRIGPTLYIGPIGISLGYTISNMDIMREYYVHGKGYTSKPAQGFYFDLSFSF